MPDDPRDFTSQYNTPLSPDQLSQFNNWASQQSQSTGRNILNDRYDYDMQGWWKNNPGVNLNGAHLTDEFKKPNHPTFSDQSQYHGVDGNQGGQWLKQPNGSFSFAPGSTNLKHFEPNELQDYFNEVEKGNQLKLPPISGARLAPDGHHYIEHQPGQFARVEANA